MASRPRLSRKTINGRLWQTPGRGRPWQLQCRVCANFRLPRSFECYDEATKHYADACTYCVTAASLKEARQAEAAAAAANPEPATILCERCELPYPSWSFKRAGESRVFYSLCPGCRSESMAEKITTQKDFTILAAQDLFPDYREYPNIPGTEVLADRLQYPGRTWFHLTRAQREQVYARAKDLVLLHTGVDLRKLAADRMAKHADDPEPDDDDQS